jgi:RNA polymerase sigma factor (sigma-70 family)
MAAAALRRAVTVFTRPPEPPDADLLRQFATDRSAAAFAALVRRHGPLVLGVCRRVVPDRHLADDSFQAAFVVLARRAGTLDPSRPLAPWLYGVAQRVALRARTMLGKRRTRETLAAVVPEVVVPSPGVDDATAILDDEIGKLPPAVRDAVILCELQGLSRRDAAAKLGVAEGTLSSRLAAARKTLAVRLQSRGVVLSVALAGAAVSPQLASAAVAAGTGAVLSSVVVSLADGASAMTLLNKLKLTAVAVLFLLLSAGGVGPWRANETSAAPVPKVARSEGVIVVSSFSTEKPIEIVKPDGTAVRVVKPDGWFKPWQTRVTADGKRAVCADMYPTVERKLKWWTLHAVRWLDLDADDAKPTTITEEVYCPTVACTPDGTAAYYSHIDETKLGGAPDHGVNLPFETWEFDPATGKKTRLKLPSDHAVLDISPDGKTLLTKTTEFGTDKQQVYLTPLGTLKPEKFSDSPLAVVHTPRFSPDGKRVLWAKVPAGPLNQDTMGVFVVEVATKKETKVNLPPGVQAYHLCWSPDGTRIAFHWWEAVPSPNGGDTASRVTVCDADGSNPTVVVKREPSKPCPGGNESIRGLDWVRKTPDASKDDPKAKPPVREPIKAPVPKAKAAEPLVAVWQGDDVRILTADGKELHKLAFKEWADRGGGFVRLSPDGKRIAVRLSDKGGGWSLVVATLGGVKPDLVVELEKTGDSLFWSPDGKSVSCGEDGKLVTVDAATGKKTTAEAEHATSVYGVTADGRLLAEYLAYDDTLQPTRKLGFLNAKLGKFKPFLDLFQKGVEVGALSGCSPLGVSADGSVAAFARVVRDNNLGTTTNVVEWVDVAKGDRTVLLTLPDWEVTPSKLAITPNGEWVVVGYQEREVTPPGQAPKSLGFTLALYDRGTGKPTLLLERDEGRIKAVDVWTPAVKVKAPVPKEKVNSMGLPPP